MKKFLVGILALGVLGVSTAKASVVFRFSEVGATVIMNASGTLDTTKLVSVSRTDGWGSTGTEDNATPGDIDIMGHASSGLIDTQFGFNSGTDISDIVNPGGPFAFSSINGINVTGDNKSFTTYSGYIGDFRQAGIGVSGSEIVAGLWTIEQTWTYQPGATFASLGLNIGTYSVSDIVTGETITIQIVPVPAAVWLLGSGLLGLVGIARRKQSV